MWKMCVSIQINKVWSLIMTGFADADRFKICIQDTVLPMLPTTAIISVMVARLCKHTKNIVGTLKPF